MTATIIYLAERRPAYFDAALVRIGRRTAQQAKEQQAHMRLDEITQAYKSAFQQWLLTRCR